jgi:L-asparaginase II
MPNPVIAEVTRGGIVESRHTGAFAVSDRAGRIVASAGDIDVPVFPRSAIKAFQCLPVIESGAADRFGFTDDEIALACASHTGELDHVRTARAMLRKAGNSEDLYECGAHWPTGIHARHDVVRGGGEALQVHNNCSGKHAGMLALSRQLGVNPNNYVDRAHPVQRAIAKSIAVMCDCDCDVDGAPCGIDGCSVPTWAIPLRNLALGFARLASPGNAAARRIVAAVRAHPVMVAGTGSFDTEIMQAVPRFFVKGGAEGVHCGCIPHAGLGIAIKCDDGAGRASEVAMAAIAASLAVWSAEEKAKLSDFARYEFTNWRKFHVGDVHAVM